MTVLHLASALAFAAAPPGFDDRASQERAAAAAVLADPRLGGNTDGFCVESMPLPSEMPRRYWEFERDFVRLESREEPAFRRSLQLLKSASADPWRVPKPRAGDLSLVGMNAIWSSTCAKSHYVLLQHVALKSKDGFVSLSESANCGSIEHHYSLRRVRGRWVITGWYSHMLSVAPGSCENYPKPEPVTKPEGFLIVQGISQAPR